MELNDSYVLGKSSITEPHTPTLIAVTDRIDTGCRLQVDVAFQGGLHGTASAVMA
jgi:hypothetical protein